MSPVPTLDELGYLLAVTEDCGKYAALARKQMAMYVDHYHFQAEEYKRQAAGARVPEVRASLLRIAASHERLVQLAATREASRRPLFDAADAADPQLDEGQDAADLGGATEGSVKGGLIEGWLAQARRHVAQAASIVAKQEALVARLSADGRHVALASEAREVLGTLKRSLALARDHLAIELNK